MEVSKAEQIGKPKGIVPSSDKKSSEGPRSPLRRKILKGLGAGLAAELGVSTGLWAWPRVDQFLKSLAPTPKPVEFPNPHEVEPGVPPSEKAVNKVPLAEITKKSGGIAMVPYGGQTTTEFPFGFSLSFSNLTIVNVEKLENDRGTWVALAMPGERLTREDIGRSTANFDGTTVEHYFYRGFTPWVLIPNDIIVVEKGSTQGFQGIGRLAESLKIGKAISFNASINQFNKNYQKTNQDSFDLLSKSLNRPNSDRSDQTFKFVADFAYIDPPQK